jgi:Protein of unknown function (DUF1501)
MAPTRRQLLSSGPAALAAAALPRPLRAASAADRKFLFVYCPGGWDQTWLFAPLFGSSSVDMPEDSFESNVGGIRYVDSDERPFLRSFFDRYASRTCFINGFEARSVAHDVCLRLSLTGTSLPAADDWPALLGAAVGGGDLLPVVHLSGPSYTHTYGGGVVRVGAANQLPELLDGTALLKADRMLRSPDPDVAALESLALSRALGHRQLSARPGREALIYERAAEAASRLDQLVELSEDLGLGDAETLINGLFILNNAFEKGLARVGVIAYPGWQHLGWDTHSDIAQQGRSLNELFEALLTCIDDQSIRPGTAGGSLADEVTIVVMSEMGRYPQLNSRGGKEHWTFTSAMLMGAGVRGGLVVGDYDENSGGQPVDLETGEVSPSGTSLLPANVGATLLALAGADPAEWVPSGEPITAAIGD